jgi:hypothetical protein
MNAFLATFMKVLPVVPKFLKHAPGYKEPKDISTAFKTKEIIDKSSGKYLAVLIRFQDESWFKTPS